MKVSFEFPFRQDGGKLLDTSAVSTFVSGCVQTVVINLTEHAGEPVLKKRKPIRQSISPTLYANWGYPKQKSQKWLWHKCLNILQGYGVFIVVRER